jgi:hypothetical protein
MRRHQGSKAENGLRRQVRNVPEQAGGLLWEVPPHIVRMVRKRT